MVTPERHESDGVFPFGRLNGPRPVRVAEGASRQLVIGTYPSALHIGWRAPAELRLPAGTTGRVASLAVDVEPTVFWDGDDADELVDRWTKDIGFIVGDGPGAHGRLTRATNGPSGDALMTGYVPRLPFGLSETAFMDVLPVFFVKVGSPSRRGQADVMESEYNRLAGRLGLPLATLPLRPTPSELPHLAVERFGPWIREVITELQPEHVVTLGDEALETLVHVEGVAATWPFGSVSEAKSSGRYGTPGNLVVSGRDIAWTPLAHPGAVRQSQGKAGGWAEAHDAWLRS